jgi:uncharacterized protein YjgD (DUF1641 family)
MMSEGFGETGELAALAGTVERLAQQVESLGTQMSYLVERAHVDENRWEMMSDLERDVQPIVKDVYDQSVAVTAMLEERGYFTFLRQLPYVADQIVTSFDAEDVRQLGDNIVLILNTVKSMTQPEIMTLMGNLTMGLREVEQHTEMLPTTIMGMMRQMRDPDVRRGLSVAMSMLKLLAQQPNSEVPGGNTANGGTSSSGRTTYSQ